MGGSVRMGQFGIGQSQKRFEDVRLLCGEGRFHHDVNLPGQVHMAVVRSTHAHARIRGIDSTAARHAPGVIAAFTGADLDGLSTMKMTLKRKRPDGSPMFAPAHRGLTQDRVRYVGDPIALVIASTAAQAADAVELVRVDYEPLPAVTSTAEAIGGPAVWDDCPDNISNLFEVGDKAGSDAAFAKAAHVVRRRYVITRVHAQYVEPRLTLWAARKLGRPVKWACERREAIPADEHARDNVSDAELALDADGRFLALRVKTLANVGAYVSSDRNLLATFSNVPTLVGVYAFPVAHAQVLSVLTNTNSTAPYRGAGRPEATYVIERLIDDAARELGMDRVELRRRNLIASTAMPFKTALGVTYDCGEFAKNMETALDMADVTGFAKRLEASRAVGRLRGWSVVNPIEQAAGPQPEFAEIRFSPSGSATVLMGSKNQGQGHETTFKQILHERLGLDPRDVRYIDGDTDRVAFGMGTMGSRSTVIGGSALWTAADKVIAKGRKIAAKLLEAAEADIVFADGKFAVAGTDKAVAIKDVARAAFQPAQLPPGVEPGFYETGTFAPKQATWPNGCHVCEVEVDPDTGAVTLDRYVVVDDVGTVINPLTLKGQIHGGVAQGVGQALMEQVVYEPESGQLLTVSFMEYAMPRADTLPDMVIHSNPVPTKLNPLGAKGAGEAGTVGALPVVINAVMHALEPLGVRTFDMPASSDRVWHAIKTARDAHPQPRPE